MTLDRAKLTAIGHADHVICNPVSFQKVDGVLDLLELPPRARVLDAGCGKAEILIRLIERRGVTGTHECDTSEEESIGAGAAPYGVWMARRSRGPRAAADR